MEKSRLLHTNISLGATIFISGSFLMSVNKIEHQVSRSEPTKTRRALVLSSGPPLSLKVLYCLHGLGIKTDVLDLCAESIVRYSRYCSNYVRIQPAIGSEEFERLADQINSCVNRFGSNVVIPGDIHSAGMLHGAQKLIKDCVIFPCSNEVLLDELDNKWLFQKFLERHGIAVPRSALVHGASDMEKIKTLGLTFPLLLKPLEAESGHGITRFDEPESLRLHLSRHAESGLPGMLVQEIVPGYDADISVLAENGHVLSYVIQSRRIPARLEFIEHEKVLSIGRAIISAANYSGVANIDVIINESTDSVSVLECNPRFWYTLQASMWRGTNFVEHGIALAHKESLVVVAPVNGLYYLHGGIVKHILWKPWQWRNVSNYNWKGFWQSFTDPFPFASVRVRNLMSWFKG